MGEAARIIRMSIFTFLQGYQHFTSIPVLLAFPYAASVLLLQSIVVYLPIFALARGRLEALFVAAGFPMSSELFSVLDLKLSQTIAVSLIISPFSLSFLLLARASVITALSHSGPQRWNPSVSSWISLFNSLFITQLCNMLVVLAANATCFFVAALLFNFLNILGLSFPGPLILLPIVVYSIVLANAYIICNLALVSSGMDRHGGFLSILKACVLIQCRTATALALTVSVNAALAAVEALFQFRVVKSYHHAAVPSSAILLEGILIAYLYAVLLAFDTVVGCVLWRSCTESHANPDDLYCHRIAIQETSSKACMEMETDILPRILYLSH